MIKLKNRKYNFFRLIFLIFSLILSRYFYIQIIDYNFYKNRSGENRLYHTYTNPPRGIIYDRNGLKLVDNTQTFSVQIYPNYYKSDDFDKNLFYKMLNSANKKSKILVTQNDFEYKIKKSGKHSPVTIVNYIDFETRALINEFKLDFPGLIFYKNPSRFYSDSLRLSHTLGYLSLVNEEDLKLGNYSINDVIGKSGIEKKYESILKGKKGVEYRVINTYGQDFGVDKEAANIAEIPGKNLFLTIDYGLQFKTENLLKGYKGAIICMDPKNGDVLAIASAPDYSLDEFIGFLPQETWNQWNEEKILLNRVTAGEYQPGSLYKLVSSIMFMEQGLYPINTTVFCDGKYELEDQSKPGTPRIHRCWKEEGHGLVNLHEAIKQSCNVYFYDMILRYQEKDNYIIDLLSDYAIKLGFAHQSGLNLNYEISGKIPNVKMLNKEQGSKNWSKRGIMPNLVIGQGEVTVTPIQVINLINLIATKGKTFRPKLVLSEKSIPFKVEFNDYIWNEIQSAMYSVVNEEKGTAYMLKNDNAVIRGKTGTAQTSSSSIEDLLSWFGGYIEKDGKMMSIVVLIEDVNQDSKTISKIISKNIFDYYIKR